MICSIEALNYRCLRHIRRSLSAFHVLVGANASGKTTFLDTISFLGRLVSGGLEAAVTERTANFQDLVWGREGTRFELAVEAGIPEGLRERLADPNHEIIRYEVAIGVHSESGETSILAEKVLLKGRTADRRSQPTLFPEDKKVPRSILTSKARAGARTILNKVPGGNDNFYSEVHGKSGKGWAPAFKLGRRKSALANLPADETKFPVSTWLKALTAAISL